MWQDFEGNAYLDEFAETCGDILRVAGFRVRQDSEEIWYTVFLVRCTSPLGTLRY